MKKNMIVALGGCAALLLGCNGGVSTVGKTPEEAGQEIANELCARAESCGTTHIDCASDGTTTTCTGSIEPVTQAECLDGAPAAFTEAVTRADAAGVDRADLDACINAMLGQGCITQAELDAYLEKVNAGMTDAVLREPPAACASLGIPVGG